MLTEKEKDDIRNHVCNMTEELKEHTFQQDDRPDIKKVTEILEVIKLTLYDCYSPYWT